MAQEFGTWTRPGNDCNAAAYEDNVNAEHYRYMLYTPAHRDQDAAGARGATVGARDWSTEPRLGQPTNLNVIQRSTTNNRAFGVLTSADTSSGPRLDTRLLTDMDSLEASREQRCRWLPASSMQNEHGLTAPVGPLFAPAFERTDEVATRVSRRNEFSKCRQNRNTRA